MQSKQFNFSSLLTEALVTARIRWRLFVLLGLLYGMAASFLLEPTQEILTALQGAVGTDGSQTEENLAPIIQNGLGMVLWGQISTSALLALLIVPWARAMSKDNLIPYEGNPAIMLGRGVRVFWHFLTAIVLLLAITMLGGLFLFAIAAALGSIAMVIIAAGIIAFVWLMIILSCIANFAGFREAQDKPIKFVEAALVLKAYIAPVAACLACLWFIALAFTVVTEGILAGLSLDIPIRINLAINGFFSFGYTACHISVLSRLPIK